MGRERAYITTAGERCHASSMEQSGFSILILDSAYTHPKTLPFKLAFAR